MASFDKSYQRVRLSEGGYQKHPNDRGNTNSLGQLVGTNWGINAQVYEKWINKPPSELDMRNMLRSTALKIYKSKYWDRIKGDLINNQFVADILFDGHVNHGYTGIKMMQSVLGVPEDGIIGRITLDAINNANAQEIYTQYKNKRIKFYRYLAKNREGQNVFLKGWLKRINKFNDYDYKTQGDTLDTASAWPLLLLIPVLFK